LLPAAHGVLGAVEPLPAFGEFGVFGSVVGEPGAGDVGPVPAGVEETDTLLDFFDVVFERGGVVVEGGVPGACGKAKERCGAVAGFW